MFKNKAFDVGLITIILLLILSGVLLFFGAKELAPIVKDSANINKVKQEANIELEKDPNVSLNFDKLKYNNKDIVGWLYIPNTSINYPILEGKEYINKNVYGNKSELGSLFILDGTSLNDARTVIYGHNTTYYGMFGELKQYYKSEDYVKKHKNFYIYTEDGVKSYSIFSVFGCHKDDKILDGYSGSVDNEDFNMMFNKLCKDNEYITGVQGVEYGKVATLVTCKGRFGTDERLLVNGVSK